MNNNLIGLSGFARSGKDTFYQRSHAFLNKAKKKSCRFAFADALKEECDELLSKYTSISAFTENNKDKELIRPLLVTYGTEIRRKLDPNCWIKKIQDRVISKLDEGYYVFVTDVRFKNEAEWIRINGGTLINIARSGCPPANHEEHKQYHFMKAFYNYHVAWDTFGEDEIEKCDEYVIPFLNQLAVNIPKFEQIM